MMQEVGMDHHQENTPEHRMEIEDPVQINSMPHTVQAAPTENIYATYAAVKAELEAARAAQAARVREITQDNSLDDDLNSMPSLEELRLERVRLSEKVRHHKDEQDSLALDIEGLPGASELYQLAARVQRLEHFAKHASDYVRDVLPQEIENTIEEDRRQSSSELLAYVQETQNKRAAILKKLTAAQESISRKKADQNPADKQASPEPVDALEAKEVAHTQENKDESVVLHQKIIKFRSMKTKLQADILREKGESEKMEERMRRAIRSAELANSRDARQCGEMNNHNAALTTTAQLVMDQLNIEHYGFQGAPTTQQLLEERNKRALSPEPTPSEHQQYARHKSGASVGSRQSCSNSVSSRQATAKPPLVAMKRTESQRARDSASREERENSLQTSNRKSATGSYQSSRRHSISKPPLAGSRTAME